jgi:uncharacterized protein (TIGR02594 family)
MNELLLTALSQYGIKEITGSNHNPTILKYFSEIGHEWVKDDETAWCSAFINWCALKAGYEHSGKLNARSWLSVGTELKLPVLGCVVVLWRTAKNSGFGHVGLYIGEDKDYVYLLGGNQGNEVNISKFPKYRVLSYRNLNKI